MSKYLTFLFLLYFTDSDAQLAVSLQKYYEYTNKAEYAIVTNKKTEASEFYNKAFQLKEEPFFADIYNSFVVNVEIRNTDYARQNYKSLKCLDYNFSTIKDSLFFKNFEENNRDFIKGIICRKSENLKLSKTLDSLYEKDQLYRKMAMFSDVTYTKDIKNGDSLNAHRLKNIFDLYGFKNEYDLHLSKTTNPPILPYQYIIIHQQRSGKNKIINFIPLLYKAVQEGKLRNKDFVMLKEEFGTLERDYSYFPLYIIDGNCCVVKKSIFVENRNAEERGKIEQVELNRRRIALTDLNTSMLYKFFNQKNKKYKLEPLNAMTLFLDKETKEKWSEHSIEIKFEDYLNYLNDKNNK